MTAVRITGATRLYAIIGDPIAQVRSPEVFTERFAAAGTGAVLIPAHVPVDRFDTVVPGLMGLGNLDGLLVTVPFKARMLPFASRLGPAAKCISAVNALRREVDGSWTGDMFDGAGFVRAVERKGVPLRGRRVLLFGAGGAGSAIAYELAKAGVAAIAIADPDAERAATLAKTLRDTVPACDVATGSSVSAGIDMIVNASPVGMRPDDGLPADIGSLRADMLVGDVVVSESPTALIRHALRYGCTHVTGRDMHSGQIEAIVDFFAATPAPSTTRQRAT
jgi:shikimate dehydrogenase